MKLESSRFGSNPIYVIPGISDLVMIYLTSLRVTILSIKFGIKSSL